VHWRLVGGGVAAALTAVTLTAHSTPPSGTTSGTVDTRPLHVLDAGFAIDSDHKGSVDITILQGSGQPEAEVLRSDLAVAGVDAKVMLNVPTCRQLAESPGAPSPVYSAESEPVADTLDYPFYEKGHLIYSVDTSAKTRGTTLWIMFSGTLSTIYIERTADSGKQPNCTPDAVAGG
jgi:hypothetical protein